MNTYSVLSSALPVSMKMTLGDQRLPNGSQKPRNPDCRPQLEVGKRRQGAGREDDTQAHIPEGTLSLLKGGVCAGAEAGEMLGS